MATEVRDEAERSRYEILVDSRVVGFAEYQVVGPDVVFPHTVIDPEFRGQGLAAELVRAALDAVRATGRRVIAQCWYVAQFIDEHPEYGDLLAS